MGAPAILTLGNPPVQSTVVETLNGVVSSTLNGPISYTSDTPAVATVDGNGLVTPVSVGTANITASDAVGGLSDTVAVTVVAAPPPPPVLNNGLTLTVPSS